jgi:hypothetical protein
MHRGWLLLPPGPEVSAQVYELNTRRICPVGCQKFAWPVNCSDGLGQVCGMMIDRVPLRNSIPWLELEFYCGISSVAGTISECCCRCSTGW